MKLACGGPAKGEMELQAFSMVNLCVTSCHLTVILPFLVLIIFI